MRRHEERVMGRSGRKNTRNSNLRRNCCFEQLLVPRGPPVVEPLRLRVNFDRQWLYPASAAGRR